MFKLLTLLFVFVLACFSGWVSPAHAQNAEYAGQTSMGINLNGVKDWNSEIPFADVFKQSRQWISQAQGAGWGKGPKLELDEQGYVTRLEDGAFVETPVLNFDGGSGAAIPDGRYTVLYDGRGELSFNGFEVVQDQPGKMVIRPQSSSTSKLWLKLTQTDPDDHVRNIRIYLPGIEVPEDESKTMFRPGFLELWDEATALRFMDWQETNNSEQSAWSDRPKPDDASYTQHGVPVEVMIELSNELQADPWFCMPHLADDDYIRNFAQTVKDQLNDDLNVYIEYSNEVWNGQFAQQKYAGNKGLELGIGDKHWDAAWKFTAKRSVEMFEIWADVFGGTERLVRVLPSQSANPYVAKQVLGFNDAYRHADALAIAPYFGMNLPGGDHAKEGQQSADEVAQWSVDRVLEHVQTVAVSGAIEDIKENKQIADDHGLALIAYEAGQHLVGIRGGENNKKLTALLHEVNASEGMGEAYTTYLNGWEDAGGGLIAMFASTGRWSKWGSWGLMEHYAQDPMAMPKFRATLQWAESLD